MTTIEEDGRGIMKENIAFLDDRHDILAYETLERNEKM